MGRDALPAFLVCTQWGLTVWLAGLSLHTVQGYNGSQCWDTSFLVQALSEGGLIEEFPDSMRKAWRYRKPQPSTPHSTHQSTT
jgi:hypothetical protein